MSTPPRWKRFDEMPSVRETAVVGAPHPDFGECVVAFVIPADKNIKNCVANYKVPKQVIVVEVLPRNTMGKVLKNELGPRSSIRPR